MRVSCCYPGGRVAVSHTKLGELVRIQNVNVKTLASGG